MGSSQKEAVGKKLLDNLQADLRALSTEAKKKHVSVKEASEGGLMRIRQIVTKTDDVVAGLLAASADIVYPFIIGCDTKNPKIVQISLAAIQRLIQHEAISLTAANNVIGMLWQLMELGIEEVKLLQTANLLITTNAVVQHDSLAKALVLAFRLHFTKDTTTMNTAGAIVRQLISVVFERVIKEDSVPSQEPLEIFSVENLKSPGAPASRAGPRSLRPCASDGYLLFQDLCQLVNADNPLWLNGITEMTRTFGLELIESVMSRYPEIFHRHPEFSFLLKERVCPVVIKLFSPSLKYRQQHGGAPATAPVTLSAAAIAAEKPQFPIVMRLLRLVYVLIKNFYAILITECEIFLSLLIKFLDADKPLWQRALSLEVVHRLCSQPQLVRCFVESYDMKQHSTKIFRDTVGAIASFIQSQFIGNPPSPHALGKDGSKTPDIQGQPPTLLNGMPVGGGVSPQAGFFYRGVWIPLIMGVPQATIKPVFLDMLDKLEAPSVSDGYGVTVAFACLLDIIRSTESLVSEAAPSSQQPSAEAEESLSIPRGGFAVALNEELINSAWCGALASFSLLLESSTDEQATEAILKSMETLAALAGMLSLTVPRDAFVTALCKASLPPHYALVVLSAGASGGSQPQPSPSGFQSGRSFPAVGAQQLQQQQQQDSADAADRSQVVAVGMPLPTAAAPLGVTSGPVMLTAKNIQCMRTLLSMAHCHGGVLGAAWYLPLTTLQHLVWILGLKPTTGGGLRSEKPVTENANAVITTAIMADLPVLAAMLSRLFESSQYLDEVALHHLVDALCKLSMESMELAYSNREPSLFAVAKLLETGLVNLSRVEVLWKAVTGHLLEVCQHPHTGMRLWGAEALTSLVKAALLHKHDPPLQSNERLHLLLLGPLERLSSVTHADVRQRQLDCLLETLQNCGDSLGPGWPVALSIMADAASTQGEAIVRVAFQSLQLVVTDFLPLLPLRCLPVCVDVAAAFGLQPQELNISLTAIGLLWNISDYFYQQREKIGKEIERERDEALRSSDVLWLCLYAKFAELCVDPRPATRKSAGQTLFSTVAAHGDLLQLESWHALLWKVLFPLLENVRKLSETASDQRDKEGPEANLLIHHSRDTAQKQWSETQVLTLAGVARVFSAKKACLEGISDFPRAWSFLLQSIELSALGQNAEVSLAALKSLQELTLLPTADGEDDGVGQSDGGSGSSRRLSASVAPTSGQRGKDQAKRRDEAGGAATSAAAASSDDSPPVEYSQDALWAQVWKAWLGIGAKATQPAVADVGCALPPTQHFLCALVQTFPRLFRHVRQRFTSEDFAELARVLEHAVSAPIGGTDSTPFLVPLCYDSTMTAVQEAVLAALDCIIKGAKKTAAGDRLYPLAIEQLLHFSEYAVAPPQARHAPPPGDGRGLAAAAVAAAGGRAAAQPPVVAYTVVPSLTNFGEDCMRRALAAYSAVAELDVVVKQGVLRAIISSLRVPLGVRYGCPSERTWKLAVDLLLSTLGVGLLVARRRVEDSADTWKELASALDEFLFPKRPAAETQSLEEFRADEAVECRVVNMLRTEILADAAGMPKDFVARIIDILNRGSIYAVPAAVVQSAKVRDEFASACFSSLLQFSFAQLPSSKDSVIAKDGQSPAAASKLAVRALLNRCKDVIGRYASDDRLSGAVPLSRHRISEASSVVKAVTIMLRSVKTAAAVCVEEDLWQLVVDLYPRLVDCTQVRDTDLLRLLQPALHEYKDLITVPPPPTSRACGGTADLNGSV